MASCLVIASISGTERIVGKEASDPRSCLGAAMGTAWRWPRGRAGRLGEPFRGRAPVLPSGWTARSPRALGATEHALTALRSGARLVLSVSTLLSSLNSGNLRAAQSCLQRRSRILELVIRQVRRDGLSGRLACFAQVPAERLLGLPSRNEMAELEEQGYLMHPHTSSGRVPTDPGLPPLRRSAHARGSCPGKSSERSSISSASGTRPEGLGASCGVAAGAAGGETLRLSTVPQSDVYRIKHLELVSLHDRTALLVLVLDQGRLEQQVVTLDEAATQDDLHVAGRLNQLLAVLGVDDLAGNARGDPAARSDAARRNRAAHARDRRRFRRSVPRWPAQSAPPAGVLRQQPRAPACWSCSTSVR